MLILDNRARIASDRAFKNSWPRSRWGALGLL
jgi:hypothetical protein